MHYTLHITNNCNMACNYCYVDKNNIKIMSTDIIRKAVDIAAANTSGSAGIIFFGGEPLLHKNLIYETVEYCRWKQKHQEGMFHFKVTTNGLLMDKSFIDFSLRENLFIALSHDGIKESHDKHRVDICGEGTFSRLSDTIDLLLENRPYAPVLMVISPDTVQYYYESVNYLYSRGFRYIICSMNYAGCWSDEQMEILKQEYEKLAKFYYDRTIKEDKFYLSPFEVKISSHINCDTYCNERCELGIKQVSIGPDGKIYPCVQFVGEPEYSIGDINTGIDEKRRQELYKMNDREKESCSHCEVKRRCNHFCGCLNKQATGSIEKVSPVLCAHERILMPIADKLAAKLFKKRNAMFIQKHYNDMYPLISAIEDTQKGLSGKKPSGG